jgi:hydrogenase/urease accessory protein HupE
MSRALQRAALLLLVLVSSMWATAARAHEFRAGVLSLEETQPGQFTVQWRPPFDGRRQELMQIRPAFPEHCTLERATLDCGEAGLSGPIVLWGLERRPVDVVVRIRWQNGATETAVLHGDDNEMLIESTPAASSGIARTLGAYVGLGVEHILFGWDHLLFVLGLVLLVGFHRRLLWTITGFTIAHSVTLACSALGWFALPQAPVEAVIALSIVLLAVEIARGGDSLTRRIPGTVAFAFGLLHGFGFSGALAEIGLPPDQIPLALLGFNLGVEVGQGLAILAAFAVWRAVGTRLQGPRPMRAAAYAMGTLASFWAFERISGFWPG